MTGLMNRSYKLVKKVKLARAALQDAQDESHRSLISGRALDVTGFELLEIGDKLNQGHIGLSHLGIIAEGKPYPARPQGVTSSKIK